MRRANLYSGIVLAVVASVMLLAVIPWQIEEGPNGMMSPRLVPYLMMGAMLGLSVLLIVTNLSGRDAAVMQDDTNPFSQEEMKGLAKIAGVFALAIALFLWVSPLAAGAGLIIGSLVVLGERRPLVILGMPAALLFALWILFYKILGTAIV